MNLNNQYAPDRRNDEIALFDLISLLWQKKWWVLLSGFIGCVLAGSYAFLAKEEWTSKTEILSPNLDELGDYLSVRKEYARIIGEPLDVGSLSSALYGDFELFMFSLDDREAFLKDSDFYQELSKDKTEEEKRKLLYTLARKNIKITKPDPKKEPDLIGRQVSMVADSPLNAQKTLEAYLNFLNGKVITRDLKSFQIVLNEKIRELEFEYEMIKRNQVVNKGIQLENLNKAYLTAQKAEIKEYLKTADVNDKSAVSILSSDAKIPLSDSSLSDSSYLFMLGEKYLKAQIDVIANKEIVYPPRFYDVERQLNLLKSILAKIDIENVKVFRYLSSPDYPEKRDWPKRFILLMIGGLLGAAIGVLITLVNFSIRRKNS